MNRCTSLGWMLQSVVLGQIAWYAQRSPLVNHKSLSSWYNLLIGHWIVMDPFHIGDHTYLACVDKLTGWLIFYCLEPGHATTTKLMSICRQLFQTYDAPEELSTDSGPPFAFNTFQEFLRIWCVKHRVSSVAYSESNGQVELAVKTTKRIVKGNTGPQGSLDNDNVARPILLYRNTPIQSIGLLPAQLLLHCWLCDSIPSQPILYKPYPGGVVAAQRHEEILHHCNARIVERYNKYTHNLLLQKNHHSPTWSPIPNQGWWIRKDHT